MTRLFAPEVIQSSAMDCGPAALASLLQGHGIRASYGRLREACQTSVDGTSIDTLEEVAIGLGLDAEQCVVPVEHVLSRSARFLPALAVVRLPSGVLHFVVVWGVVGGLVQLMDPGTGRRWVSPRGLLDELYVHELDVPADAFREYAATAEFTAPLLARLGRLGVPSAARTERLARALEDPSPLGIGALDAATRLGEWLVAGRAVSRGTEVAHAIDALVATPGNIPPRLWSARAAVEPGAVTLRGAVLLRVRGKAERAQETPPELSAVLSERSPSALRTLAGALAADGVLQPAVLVPAIAASAAGLVAQALVLRGLFDVQSRLGLVGQRVGAVALVAALFASALLLDVPILARTLALGRRLDGRLRLRLLAKLPRLPDRYFSSRLVSDVASRAHEAHLLRGAPAVAAQVVRATVEIALVAAGLAWLDPAAAPLAVGAAALVIVAPLVANKRLAERDMRARAHAGALSRFYLDALLGVVAVRAHGGERAVRAAHEGLLVEWLRATLGLIRISAWIDLAQAALGFALAALLIGRLLGRGDGTGAALLVGYWSLMLPQLGAELAMSLRQYPAYRSLVLRLVEPLDAPEESAAHGEVAQGGAGASAIALEGVTVRAGGHTILEDVALSIAPGEHVAVVGPSGAGKSTLVGLLLGWHGPAAGTITVDGVALEGAHLQAVRRAARWVDPAVQLWNASLYDNLRYGSDEAPEGLGRVVDAADLRGVVERLPEGLATSLGEGGGLVSGGEGQRVRLGRALARPAARLVLLDEPFRGLDRERRRALLARVRETFAGATLICVTHDVAETAAFPRAIVIERGHVVEDGAPAALLAEEGSRYRALLEADRDLASAAWSGEAWRRIRMDGGALEVEPG